MMKHPDMPGLDAWTLIRVFDEATVEKTETQTSEVELAAGFELDGRHSGLRV